MSHFEITNLIVVALVGLVHEYALEQGAFAAKFAQWPLAVL